MFASNKWNSDSVITVTFNHTQSIDDLMRIKADLATKGIVLNFRKLAFDELGELDAMAFHVSDNKAGGSDTVENLTDVSTVGFFYDYRKNAKHNFGAGDLKRIHPVK